MAKRITPRERRLLHMLCLMCSVTTQSLIGLLWDCGLGIVRRAVLRLIAEGLLLTEQRPVRRPPVLQTPRAVWEPGWTLPVASSVLNSVQRDWRCQPVETTDVLYAAPKSRQLYGCRPVRLDKKLSHDIAVSQVAIRYLNSRPEEADQFRHESLFAFTREHQKLPDAALIDPRETTIVRAIEIVSGSYTESRVRAFIDDCASRCLPFEIW